MHLYKQQSCAQIKLMLGSCVPMQVLLLTAQTASRRHLLADSFDHFLLLSLYRLASLLLLPASPLPARHLRSIWIACWLFVW